MSQPGETGTPPLVEIDRAISVTLNLSDHCKGAGTNDGINLYVETGLDGWIIAPEQLREIAAGLVAVADERERER